MREIFFALIILVGLGIAFLIQMVFVLNRKRASDKLMASIRPVASEHKKQSIFITLGERMPWLEKVVLSSQREVISRKLWRLGNTSSSRLATFGAIKLGISLVMLMIGLLVAAMLPKLGFLIVLVFVAIGFYLPDRQIDSRIKTLDEDIVREFPEILDLLTLCIRSGMTFDNALRRVAKSKHDSVFGPDLELVVDRINLGESLSETMVHLRTRDEVSPMLADFLKRTEVASRLGVPLGQSLEQSATEMRKTRFEAAKTAAAKLPVKILMPMMLCLLPAMLIVVLGPAILRLIDGFSQL